MIEWIRNLFSLKPAPKKVHSVPPRPSTPVPSVNTPKKICSACVACILRHEEEKKKGETP